jgi:hypothetical protein
MLLTLVKEVVCQRSKLRLCRYCSSESWENLQWSLLLILWNLSPRCARNLIATIVYWFEIHWCTPHSSQRLELSLSPCDLTSWTTSCTSFLNMILEAKLTAARKNIYNHYKSQK